MKNLFRPLFVLFGVYILAYLPLCLRERRSADRIVRSFEKEIAALEMQRAALEGQIRPTRERIERLKREILSARTAGDPETETNLARELEDVARPHDALAAMDKLEKISRQQADLGHFIEAHAFKRGDRTYYLHGALSIGDFDIEKKFNNKAQSIMAQTRPIRDEDMPWYAKYVLVFYPYPSFKFGYSLTAALLTAPFPDSFFEKRFSRLAFVNGLLIAGCLALFFLTIRRLTAGTAPAVFGCLFFLFDVSNAHNSFDYESHTIAGLFPLLLAFHLFIRSRTLSPFRFALISFLHAYAVLSSSHVIPLAVFQGFLILLSVFRRHRPRVSLKHRLSPGKAAFHLSFFAEGGPAFLKTLGAAAAGCLIPWAYILGVETAFHFRELGLPTLQTQLANYSNTVDLLISTYPRHLRFIWDPRLFNIFAVPIGVISALLAVHHLLRLKREGNLSMRGLFPALLSNRGLGTFLLTLLLSTATVAVYTQPITRGMTPYTVLYGVLMGALLGSFWRDGGTPTRAAISAVIAMVALNFYVMLGFLDMPQRLPSPHIIRPASPYPLAPLDYYQSKNYHMLPQPLGEFLSAQALAPADCYVRIDPMEMVIAYAFNRRFIPQFTPPGVSSVTAETFLEDFRLIRDIFDLKERGLLPEEAVVKRRKIVWDFPEVRGPESEGDNYGFALWDQEYHYIFGYAQRVHRYWKRTPLAGLDTHSLYFIRLSALREVHARAGG